MTTIRADTLVLDVPPRLSKQRFREILQAAGSPAVVEAESAYDAVVAEGGDPLFALAVFEHESRMATHPDSVTVRYQLHNPGATRSSTIGPREIVATNKGPFVRYRGWTEGFRDMIHRLKDPAKPYLKAGAKTPGTIIPIWAPSEDNNNPDGYTAAVVRDMNRWQEPRTAPEPVPVPAPTPPGERPLRVVLAAGHHNHSGGNPVEHRIVASITEQLHLYFERAGAKVTTLTPDGPDDDDLPGDGEFHGTLADVAAKVVEIDKRGDTVDFFLEVHTEGNGAGNAGRGLFTIYPDWPAHADLDVDVRDRLGPAMSKLLSERTGIPLRRGTGLMSERETGVGAQGWRLAIFGQTAAIKDHLTRCIVEFGAHTSPLDLAILEHPDHARAAAIAVVESVFAFYGRTPRAGWLASAPPATSDPDIRFFPETGRHLGHGFLHFWEQHGGLMIFGYPITEEFDAGGWVVQYTERAKFMWKPETGPRLALVGSELAERLLRRGALGPEPFLRRARVDVPATADFFIETGHSLNHGFRQFWRAYGGLEIFGYPISEEIEAGRDHTVQWFERARFEWRKGVGTPFDVQLGLVGSELYALTGAP